MNFTIKQPCPSCGAPIELGEEDRLIRCSYCEVINYKIYQKIPRYVLPMDGSRNARGKDLFLFPYLRFKGTIFLCHGKGVDYKFVDTTRVGTPVEEFPVSLGLRPQAMNVQPVTEQVEGRFIRQSLKSQHIVSEAVKLTTFLSKDKYKDLTHRAFIGETISRVYLPVYKRRGDLIDGVSNAVIGPASILESAAINEIAFQKKWEPVFLSAICRKCGAEMNGAPGSLVMHCNNCDTLWQEQNGSFNSVPFHVVGSSSDSSYYLPFWKLEVADTGNNLQTLADFLRLTNQPIVVRNEHTSKMLTFFVPAFKISPNKYLNLAKSFTLLQMKFDGAQEESFEQKNLYPVTLNLEEAVQSLKSVTTASSLHLKSVIEILPSLQYSVKRAELLYLPFHKLGRDLIEQQTGISVSSAILKFGLLL